MNETEKLKYVYAKYGTTKPEQEFYDISYGDVREVVSVKEIVDTVNTMLQKAIAHKRYNTEFVKQVEEEKKMKQFYKGDKITLDGQY